MSGKIAFYYDYLSPYSYLAFTRLPGIAHRTGWEIDFKPIDVLAVMDRVGNSPTTVLCAAKGQYAVADLTRWAHAYQVPFSRNPHLRSINGRTLLLATLAAEELGHIEACTRALFEAVWIDKAGFADDAELLEVLARSEIADPAGLVARSRGLMANLETLNEEAANTGIFGVPSFVVGEDLFFGNDRLLFLEQRLAQ